MKSPEVGQIAHRLLFPALVRTQDPGSYYEPSLKQAAIVSGALITDLLSILCPFILANKSHFAEAIALRLGYHLVVEVGPYVLRSIRRHFLPM